MGRRWKGNFVFSSTICNQFLSYVLIYDPHPLIPHDSLDFCECHDLFFCMSLGVPFKILKRVGANFAMSEAFNYSESEFPILGCHPKKITCKQGRQSVSHIVGLNCDHINSTYDLCREGNNKQNANVISGGECLSNQRSNQKSSEWRKPPPTFCFSNINMPSMMPKKSNPKRRLKMRRIINENNSLSGNPLDADNPIRQRGITNLVKKPKSISKIKTAVYEGREELKKIKDLSVLISIQNDVVLCDSEIPDEYLWKSICYGKGKDLKNILNSGKSEVEKSNELVKERQTMNNNIDERVGEVHLPTFLNNENSHCISLHTLLQNSAIPSYKMLIHHHNFKNYCDNCITQDLNRAATAFISQIVRFQYNKYQTNPVRAMANRRYVLGLKQVTKFVKRNKIKIFIIVPDMEDSLSETVNELKSLAVAYSIPYFFALSRQKLGHLVYKKVGISCFGILDYSGAEMNLFKTMEYMAKAKLYYKEKCSRAEEYFLSWLSNRSKVDNSSMIENLDETFNKFKENFSLQDKIENTSIQEIPN